MTSPERYRDRYNAAPSALGRAVVVADIQEAVRAWRWTPPISRQAPGYKTPPPGRPVSTSNGRVLERASEASGLSAEELRVTLSTNRSPHSAIRTTALAEITAGTSCAAVGRELGVSERTVRRWVSG